jgi:hypothetical protein
MTTRPGFVFVSALLVLMVLAVLGTGILTLGAREMAMAHAMEERARVELAAEAAARDALARWSTRGHAELAIGEESTVAVAVPGETRVTATVRRLDSRLFLVHATAHAGVGSDAGAPARASAGLLVHALLPHLLEIAFPAAIVAEDHVLLEDGDVGIARRCHAPPPAGVQAPAVVLATGFHPSADPPLVAAPPPPIPEPSPVADPLAGAAATLRLDPGAFRPDPGPAGSDCRQHPLNWGATTPGHPCSELRPFVLIGGDARIHDGEGAGFLVVQGDLLIEHAIFHGIIFVYGHLTLGPGATVHGSVRGRTVELRGGDVRFDGCAIDDALRAGHLDGPFRAGERWWIPVF